MSFSDAPSRLWHALKPEPEVGLPQITVVTQYLRDLSFKIPNAPRAMALKPEQLRLSVAVEAPLLGETDFEVTLRFEGSTQSRGTLLLHFELAYCGVFRVVLDQADDLQRVVRTQCPYLLFPFAREIVAKLTRDAGFPPVVLPWVDFAAVDRNRMAVARPAAELAGLTIVGHLSSEIGLGQAARNLVCACETQSFPLSVRDLVLPSLAAEREFTSTRNQIAEGRARLVVIGASSFGQHLTVGSDRGIVNILYPFWELNRLPWKWLGALRRFDDIWAPTAFVASAFAEALDRSVRHVRLPLRLPPSPPPPRPRRESLKLFTFLDYDSYGARKNPVGAVKAFQAAFMPGQRDVELVVKTRGFRDQGLRRWLGEVAAADRRINVIDRTLGRAQMDALMASCDAFVSLHRSEGFGLGAAEALAAGKAVVVTDYGGTTDFVTPATGYPVDYRLEPVLPGQYPEEAVGSVWADPRQEAAVVALRSIYHDPSEADARARRGFELLHAQNGLNVVGTRIEALLHELGVL